MFQGFTSVLSSLNDANGFTVVTKAMDVTDFTTDEKEVSSIITDHIALQHCLNIEIHI